MAQYINLSINAGVPRPRIYLSQYDVGRHIVFYLLDDGADYTPGSNAAIKIEATKPSGLGFSVQGSFSDNMVTVVTTETMTNEYGEFPAELKITQGTTVLGTANFVMSIEKSPHPGGTVDGDGETILNEMAELIQRGETASQAAITSAESASASEERVLDAEDSLSSQIQAMQTRVNSFGATLKSVTNGMMIFE